MKCIACDHDARYKERAGGACPSCGRKFAFEPKRGDRLTDVAFRKAIERVSSDGKVMWTPSHLYYEVVRRVSPRSSALAWGLGVAGGLAALLASKVPFLSLLAALFWAGAAAALPRRLARLTRPQFDAMWGQWQSAHGQPHALIVRRQLPEVAAGAAAPRELPSDIAAYSFDRAVITDRPETVDLLLANNFHFENNCAVLSEGGYPAHAFDIVRGMLQNNPKLTVYALHDATPAGCSLPARLASSPEWFQGSARVVDVGLRPMHAAPFKGCWRGADRGGVGGLPDKEKEWLARYALDLAVIRPEQVIKRLFRAIASTAALTLVAVDGGGYYVDSTAFAAEATASDGGGDSFG
jgi:hypothetical protein